MNKLITMIDTDRQYSINDLLDICKKAGYDFTKQKIYHMIRAGKINTCQIGGKYTDHYISGEDFQAFFLDYTNV